MSRHKKTRKEKIIADYRHQVYILKDKSSTESVLDKDMSFNNSTPAPAIAVYEDSYTNTHVLRDITKTGILTFSIITFQIILFFLLTRHIITLPIVKY